MRELAMAYFVYMLECADKTYYCGYATDLKKRLKAHNAGKGARYTRARLPVRLVFSEKFRKKSIALKREAEIKKLSRKEKEKLVLKNTC